MSGWNKIKSHYKSQTDTVKAAYIGGVVTLFLGIMALIPVVNSQLADASGIQEAAANYKASLLKSEEKRTELVAEVQRLETVLTPFRTIALQKYTGTDQEALRKLSDFVVEIQAREHEREKTIAELNSQLSVLKQKVSPRRLTDGQRQALRKLVESLPLVAIGVASDVMQSQTKPFAEDIASAIIYADGSKSPLFGVLTPPVGIGITRSPNISDEVYASVIQSLTECGLSPTEIVYREGMFLGTFEHGGIYITVGARE